MNIGLLNPALRQIIGIFTMIMALTLLTACSSDDNKESGTASIPLSSPKTVSITGQDGSLLLYWTKLAPVQDVDATYEVFYNTVDNFTTATKVDENATIAGMLVSLTLNGLQNGTTYYIYVRASYAGIGTADVSAAFSGMPIPAPATPTLADSIGWDGILEVVWNEPQYAHSYKIFWEQNSSGLSPVATPPSGASLKTVTTPRALITGVANGDTYHIWVQAVNTAGDSGYLATSLSSSVSATSPAAPTAGTITPASKQLVVSFDAISLASGYKLRYATTDDYTATEAVTSEMSVEPASGTVIATIPGLTNDTLYYVWVQATNSQGASAFTAMGSGTPVSGGAIDYTNLDFALGSATAEYTWAEQVPASAFFPVTGRYSDRLSRFRETAIGNLFCDAAAWYVRNVKNTPIDFVFLNGGFIEGPIAQGNIKLEDIYSIVFSADAAEDTLVVVTLKGEDVIKVFKTSAATNHTGRGSKSTGGWGIVSQEVNYTVRYKTLDETIYPADGSNPVPSEDTSLYQNGWIADGTLKINGSAINPSATYRIATTSYLANGNEGYLAFLNATDRTDYSEYFWQTVAHYIYEVGSVTPETDGRIKLVGGVPLTPPGWEAGDLNWTAPYNNAKDAIYPEYAE